MNVGSLFSGIGGLDLGLHRAGMSHVFFCESDPYRRDVLRARFPGVPVYEDVRAVATVAGWETGDGRSLDTAGTGRREQPREPGFAELASVKRRELGPQAVHLLCGGFPCQDLSVAGRRAGLAGERSGLFYEFARIAESLRPRWLLVENVPGLLSSNGGRDFGVVLGTLADLGYGLAWRILDSRYFGVPQRRRRVFIVGTLAGDDPRGAAERAGEVLAVGTRCPRHSQTRGEKGQDASIASLSGLGSGGPDDNDGQGGRLVANGLGTDSDAAAPLSHGSNPNSNQAGRRREDDENLVIQGGSQQDAWQTGGSGTAVRRLTPVECERLQALPDGWTDLGGTSDSRRYAALGDAVTVSVGEWLGRRIMRVAV